MPRFCSCDIATDDSPDVSRRINRASRRANALAHYRMAQVADLQRQRTELAALKGAEQPVDLALQFAKLDSALRFARLALAQILDSLSTSERTRFIRVHGPKPSERLLTPRSYSQVA
jgi:hypothetical protein